MGIKTLKHVSVSHEKRKKLRLLFFQNNALNFYEGNLDYKETSINLRKNLIESLSKYPLNLEKTDDVLFISDDLTPVEVLGTFLVCTLQKKFFVLKGNSHLHELIDLNQKSKVSRLISSISGLFSTSIIKQEFPNVVINLMIISNHSKKQIEEFKAIILEDFKMEVRFVNIPKLEGEKCIRETILLHSIDLQSHVMSKLNQADQLVLVQSSIYKIGEYDLSILFLLKDTQEFGSYSIITVTVELQEYKKSEPKELRIYGKDLQSIEFIKINENLELGAILLMKETYKQKIIIKKLYTKELYVGEEEFIFESCVNSNSLICKSQNENIFLLTSYEIYELKYELSGNKSRIFESQEIIENDNESYDDNFHEFKEIDNFFKTNQPHLQKAYERDNKVILDQKFNEMSDFIERNLGYLRKSIKKSAAVQEDSNIEVILKYWISLTLYRIIINHEDRTEERYLVSNPIKFSEKSLKSIRCVFTKMNPETFLSIWLEFFVIYNNQKDFNDHISKVMFDILNNIFGEQINEILNNLCQYEPEGNELLDLNHQILSFIDISSGIIQFDTKFLDSLLLFEDNKKRLKNIALKSLNFYLMAFVYYTTGEITHQELKNFFNQLKIQSENYKEFVTLFFEQYIRRMTEPNSIHHKSRNLLSIISLFSDELNFICETLTDLCPNLRVLFALKFGQRIESHEEIFSVAHQIRKKQNQEVTICFISRNFY